MLGFPHFPIPKSNEETFFLFKFRKMRFQEQKPYAAFTIFSLRFTAEDTVRLLFLVKRGSSIQVSVLLVLYSFSILSLGQSPFPNVSA